MLATTVTLRYGSVWHVIYVDITIMIINIIRAWSIKCIVLCTHVHIREKKNLCHTATQSMDSGHVWSMWSSVCTNNH